MTILLYLMVIVFGFYSFSTLPLALMLSMEIPAAIVYATYPGAGPEDIEQQVTKPLESAVAGLSGLDTLQSTSSENMSMVIIQFTDSTNLDDAMTDLRDKVSQVKSQLPDDASDPTVMSIDIDSMPVVQVALRGSDLAALQSIAEDDISPALERLDGVASVDISGGYEDEVAVKTNAARLKGYNLTITSVAQQLGADNMFLFGLHADEVVRLKREGYAPQKLYARDENLRAVIDKLKAGFSDGVSYDDLASRLLMNDEYMLLQDFASYCAAEQRMADTYARSEEWNRMSLINIARSGIFAADRAVAQYADTIWQVPHK